MNYFEGKEKRIIKAEKHTEEMWKNYKDEIYNCVLKTKRYSDRFFVSVKRDDKKQNITLTDGDSVSAVFNHQKGKVCVLNFASYKNPGGMFLRGSKAQEECLCHESFLYNVLSELDDYYTSHFQTLNRSLYTNDALYTPNIRFFRDNKNCLADVITCAAPNYKAASKYHNVSKFENLSVLKDRTRFVLDVASEEQVDTLILGAWGCGVFGQDPTEVAECFMNELKKHQDIENIVFAVIDKNFENYKTFEKVINSKL